MSEYVFGDSDNFDIQCVPAGDYKFRIVKADEGLQAKGKTSGSKVFDLKLLIFSKDDAKLTLVSYKLIFHPSLHWKIDTFLKSSNYLVNGQPPVKGQPVPFTQSALIGLRGWCTLGVREYDKSDGTGKGKANEVTVWLTDRDKLPKEGGNISEPAPVSVMPGDSDPDWD